METALTVRNEYYLAPAAEVETILRAYQTKHDIIEKVLRQDLDYGPIPGSTKPALLKPGAEKLANMFGLAPVFADISVVEDWTGADHNGEPFFYYRQKCSLYKGDRLMGSADGSCNSWEKKYRYRQAERVCPQCGKPAIIKGKVEYGGGWVCFKKKDGCGTKFSDNDAAITGQEVGTVANPDMAEQVNTILKMAQKRALVAATLIVTGASDYFTQDVDDFLPEGAIDGTWIPAGATTQSTTQTPDTTNSKPDKREQPTPTTAVYRAEAPAPEGKLSEPEPVKDKPANQAMLDKWRELYEHAVSLGLTVETIPAGIGRLELAERGKALRARVAKVEETIGTDEIEALTAAADYDAEMAGK